MVMQRSKNTVPIRLHMRRKRMDLQVTRDSSLKPDIVPHLRLQRHTLMQKTVRTLPVLMQQKYKQPDVTENHSTCLSHGKGPWYPRHAVGKEKKHDKLTLNVSAILKSTWH